jgi:hypothetical protein
MPHPNVAISSSGRFVAVRQTGELKVVDIRGMDPDRYLGFPSGQFAFIGGSLCLLENTRLRLLGLEGGTTGEIDVTPGTLRSGRGRNADSAFVEMQQLCLVPAVALKPTELGASLPSSGTIKCFALHNRSYLYANKNRTELYLPGRPMLQLKLPLGSDVLDAVPVFGGRLIALWMKQGAEFVAMVWTQAGQLVHHVRVANCQWHSFAIERGHLLVGNDQSVTLIDLRLGRVVSTTTTPHLISELACDDDGRTAILIDQCSDGPATIVIPIDQLLRESSRNEGDDRATNTTTTTTQHDVVRNHIDVIDEASIATNSTEVTDELPLSVALAFGSPRNVATIVEPTSAKVFCKDTHLQSLMDLMATRAGLAIAEGWHDGRISGDGPSHHPFEKEVAALAGAAGQHAPEQLAAARKRLTQQSEALARKARLSLASGIVLPFVEIAQEFQLSATAAQILLAVIAPQARVSIARLYHILSNETTRPIVDRGILFSLFHRQYSDEQLAVELSDGCPLLRYGLIQATSRGGLSVDEALIDRLRCIRPAKSAVAELRGASVNLDQLVGDRAVFRSIVAELSQSRSEQAPLRMVLRGRRGAGRHTIVAALAATVGRQIVCIDASELPRGSEFSSYLRRELMRSRLMGAVPVISGLESQKDDDALHGVRQVLRMHPGPIVARTSADSDIPFDPGHLDFELPPLSESVRLLALQQAARSAGLNAECAGIAHRYRIGPGTVATVVSETARRMQQSTSEDATTVLANVARQHVATRIGHAAQRVTKLATWDQVALPDDMLESLRELIGRARHSRTVLESWGYEHRVTSSKGLTALFYGPPGTGKTMVAGLMARELGLDLYRVDLAKVMSKWVGETEKNLGEVFDAAQDGQIMLLFDEADSLFAKRSDVKSSNDRYANLEVNYLLQRLDAFEGVAILTTNLEGSIDPAFRRRLSMRLNFPFPDDELRSQLWAQHITPQTPTVGDLDFPALARRFRLSGGYIRNSALRAAYLAAQENQPLSQAHLERAVLLEYRELGKLSDNGRME